MVDLSDDELLAELGVSVEQKPVRAYTPQQERIIAGFCSTLTPSSASNSSSDSSTIGSFLRGEFGEGGDAFGKALFPRVL